MTTNYYYSCPNSQANYSLVYSLQFESWYPATTICRFIRDLRQINFSTQEGRNQGLTMITSLTPSAPFVINNYPGTSDTRFGDDTPGTSANPSELQFTTYVAGYCDGWDAVFAALMNSLNFKDATNLTNPDTPSTPLDIMRVYNQFNDASQAFRWALTNAQTLLRRGVGLYNGFQFESKYGLVFSTATQPIPVLPVPRPLLPPGGSSHPSPVKHNDGVPHYATTRSP